jgi:hypothetical protein
MLIAGTVSDFKKDVITRVLEKLGAQDYFFEIIGLDKLAETETGHPG